MSDDDIDILKEALDPELNDFFTDSKIREIAARVLSRLEDRGLYLMDPGIVGAGEHE